MTFPTPFTVGWHAASSGPDEDANGDPVITHTPALDVAGTEVRVMGWAPTASTELQIGRVDHDIDLYVPPSVAAGSGDVVDLPEGQFEVVGSPLDWSKGPFGFTPGFVVQLKRVSGG